MTNETAATPGSGSVEHVLGRFEDFRKRMEHFHVPEFLEIDITMSQAKILLLLENAGELHMSDIVKRIGVSLSTLSGHVDRLVENGLVVRRTDPADRRQVRLSLTPAALEMAERFRQLNTTQLRRLLERMSREERLDVIRAFDHFTRAIEQELLERGPDPERTTR